MLQNHLKKAILYFLEKQSDSNYTFNIIGSLLGIFFLIKKACIIIQHPHLYTTKLNMAFLLFHGQGNYNIGFTCYIVFD